MYLSTGGEYFPLSSSTGRSEVRVNYRTKALELFKFLWHKSLNLCPQDSNDFATLWVSSCLTFLKSQYLTLFLRYTIPMAHNEGSILSKLSHKFYILNDMLKGQWVQFIRCYTQVLNDPHSIYDSGKT